MIRRPATWVAILAAAVAAGVVAVVAASDESSPPPRESGVAARQTTEAPQRCTDVEARAAVARLVRAYNAGDRAGLRRALAGPGDFRWFTVEDRASGGSVGAYRPRAVLDYAARRHRAHERLRVVSFAFNGRNASYGHFEFEVVRRADDVAPVRYPGKGAVLCTVDPPAIAVWAMGREGA